MCEDDLQALLAELADDVDFQKKRAISLALSAASTSPRPISFFERLIESIKETKTLGELEDVLRRYARSRDLRHMAIMPLKFIAHNVEVVENVEFIHYTDEESGDSINREGFRGRKTPHRQTLTREIQDTRVLDGGYIFAYPWESRLIDTVVDSVHGVWGEASQALAFNFEPDGGERQLLVPVSCIYDYEYTYRPNPSAIHDNVSAHLNWRFPSKSNLENNAYLPNLKTGGFVFYHATERGCDSLHEVGRTLYLSMVKDDLFENNILPMVRSRGDLEVCEVRVRGVSWEDILDIGEFYKSKVASDIDYLGDDDGYRLNLFGIQASRALMREYPELELPRSYYFEAFEQGKDHKAKKSLQLGKLLGLRGHIEDESTFTFEDYMESDYIPETLALYIDDDMSIEVVSSRKNPLSEVAAVRGYLVNPHALDEDGLFEWYHRSSDDDLEFERMEDSQSKFPAFYLSSTASSVIDLGGSYNDTVYVINIKEGKYLDITNIPEDELAEIQSCLVSTLEGRGIPRQDAIYLADYQLKMFKKSEMWYWMESLPVPSAEVEMTVDYVSVISTIKGSKVKVPGSKRTYIFYRGYPNWNYPAVFIDCLKSLGYDGWFETQDSTTLPQITVALLNPMEKAERNFEYPLYYAESLVERGQLP